MSILLREEVISIHDVPTKILVRVIDGIYFFLTFRAEIFLLKLARFVGLVRVAC